MTRQERRNSENAQRANSTIVAEKSDNKIGLILIVLYLIIDFIPQTGAIDPMGPQWLYLAVLNLVTISYILYSLKNKLLQLFDKFSQNTLVLSFLAVFILCGISMFFALNPVESLVVYSRLIITIIAFFNICIILYNRPKSIEILFQIVTIMAIIQCVPLLFTFIKGLNTTSVDVLILNMRGNAGNKNVMAASLVTKTPIIIYCIFSYFSLWRYLINLGALMLVVLMIFLLNARAAYLGLFVELGLFLIFLIAYKKQAGLRLVLKHLSAIFIPVLFGLIASQTLIKANEQDKADEKGTISGQSASIYTTIDKRLATLSDHNESSTNARLFFWENALKQIKKTPAMGVGYGNWKIVSVKYEYDFYNDFNYSKHAHNDFLQITAEAGILTGLLFIAIFVFAFIYTIKTWKTDTPLFTKVLIVTAFMSLIGYAVDASFNFPAERPTNQIPFAFALAAILAIFLSLSKTTTIKPENSTFKTLIIAASLILVLVSIYTTYYTYRSMVVQTATHFTFGTPTKDVTWQDVNPKLPDIPNLAENNIPINDTKAWYLFLAGRNEEALSLLNQDKNANPYSMSKEWLKSTIFTSQGKIDSAHYYSKKGFFQRPRNLSLFNLISRTSVPLKDTLTIQRAFHEYHKFREEPHAWKIYMRSLFAVNYNRSQLIQTADSIAKVYPNDAEIQHTRFFIRAGNAAMKKNFSESLENLLGIMKIYPNDYENLENIGLTYYYMKDYSNAATYFKRVTDAKVYGNGKSEFFLGNCLLELRRKQEACGYLSTAANKNYPMAAILFNKNNCELQSLVPQ